jgi:hypothetical protein
MHGADGRTLKAGAPGATPPPDAGTRPARHPVAGPGLFPGRDGFATIGFNSALKMSDAKVVSGDAKVAPTRR